jgi:hypothetical protein
MCVWTSRRDARGATSFISYQPRTIEMLKPPGSEVPRQLAERSGLEEGLWTLARWPRNDDTIVDIDEPMACEPLRTVVVLAHVGEGLRREVGEIMHEQLNYAWMLCDPQPTRLVEDRRARRHAALLMQLSSEIHEAFPGEGLWRADEHLTADLPDYYDQFLLMLRDGRHEREGVAGARSISTWVVALALTRVLLARLRGRRQMTVGDVGEYMRPAKSQKDGSGEPGPNERPDAVVTHT